MQQRSDQSLALNDTIFRLPDSSHARTRARHNPEQASCLGWDSPQIDQNKGCPAGAPLKTGLLGCLGRVFETHLAGKQTHERRGDRKAEKLNDCEKGILPVLQTHAPMKPHRPLTERERRLLVALSGCEQDRIIIDALDHQVLSMCSSIFS